MSVTGTASSTYSKSSASLGLLATESQSSGGRFASPDATSTAGRDKFLQTLQQLKSKDPQQFKQVLEQASASLKSAAQQQTPGSQSAQDLTKLAAKLQQAATSGDLSSLKPTRPANVVAQAYGVTSAAVSSAGALAGGVASVTSVGAAVKAAGSVVSHAVNTIAA